MHIMRTSFGKLPLPRRHDTRLCRRTRRAQAVPLPALATPADASRFLQEALAPNTWEGVNPHFGTSAMLQYWENLLAATAISTPKIGSLNLDDISGQIAPQLAATSDAIGQLVQAAGDAPAGLLKEVSDPFTQAVGQGLAGLEDLPPHFGTIAATEALGRALDQLHLSQGVGLAGEATAQLRAALVDLQQASPLGPVLFKLSQLTSDSAETISSSLSQFPRILPQIPTAPDLFPLAQSLLLELQQLPSTGIGGYSLGTVLLILGGAFAAVAASTPASNYTGPDPLPGDSLTHDYDPDAVAAYFKRRPAAVIQRAGQVAAEVLQVGSALLMDYWRGELAANEAIRARQLRATIERLGPAYVKVAQALSTRVDLLTPEYFTQIQLLQDRVPPFPCEVAREAMQQAFGRPVDDVFASLSSRPVAAASLGQVYRATLRPEMGGGDVAVKVQRPDVLQQVALDLYLMRSAAAMFQKVADAKTDWAGLIDNWATRFLHEMDYEREARNAKRFAADVAGLSGIQVPEVVLELSNDVVLTTVWVTGEKLSESRAADVRELCNTLLNAYLIQLLDTGFLHADPHPGNLIRTPEGKICILDYGLMTEVTPDQRLALLEYIAHLTTQDWVGVSRDLQRLDFIPPNVGAAEVEAMAVPLGQILIQLSGGGGAAKINIDAVTAELEALGKRYPFRVPPFFALILRAFSVIEGIALRVDPDYSIVQQCFPYLARRLLSDDSPRAQAALRDVLYGGKRHLDVQRLIRVIDGFAAFTTDGLKEASPAPSTTASAEGSTRQRRSGATVLDATAVEALRVVFSSRGSYVQSLLVEEAVAAVDALSREALSGVAAALLGSAPAALALSSVEALGPLRRLLLPLPTPLEVLSRLAPALAVTAEDEEALDVVRGVATLMQRLPPPPLPLGTPGATAGPASVPGLSFADAAATAAQLQALVPELLPGVAHTGNLFARALVRRVALRAAAALSSGPSELEQSMAALAFMPGLRAGPGAGPGQPGAGLGRAGAGPGFGPAPLLWLQPQQKTGGVQGLGHWWQ